MEESIAHIESLNTVSVSVYEAKSGARSLGYKNVKGFAKGIRTIAGSMILTVIEDNPLRQLVNMSNEVAIKQPGLWGGWSVDRYYYGTGRAFDNFDFTNKLAVTLPPFNLLMTYVSEGASFNPQETLNASKTSNIKEYDVIGAADLLVGIEIISVGKVTSIHDTVTELTVSFQALDYKPLSKIQYSAEDQLSRRDFDKEKEAQMLSKLFPSAPVGELWNQSAPIPEQRLLDLAREDRIDNELLMSDLHSIGAL